MARGTGATCPTRTRSRGETNADRPLLNNGELDQSALIARLEELPDRSNLEAFSPLVRIRKENAHNFYVTPDGGSRLESRHPHSAAEVAAYAAEVIAIGKPKRRAWLELPPPAPEPDETSNRYEQRLRVWVANAYPRKLVFMFGLKTHVGLAHAAAAQLHELTCRMPWTVQGLRSLSVYGSAWYGKQGTALGGHIWGLFQRGAIYLNPVWWENEPRFRRALVRNVRIGFHPPGCDTPESVVTHEMGHLVDYMLDRDRKHAADWRAFKTQAKVDGLTLPSTYAHHDEHLHDMEAVAESFSEIVHSPEELSPYATALKTWLADRKLLD